MKFWDKLGKTWQRVILASTILGVLSGGGFSLDKGIRWARDYAHVPVIVDSLDSEMVLMWEVLQTVHDDQKLLERGNEMMWHLLMANTDKHGRKAYFITSMGDILTEGSKINVFVRDDHVSPPEQWVFFRICEGRDCLHFLFAAKWSGVYNQFYFVDFQGEEHLIYEE